jgi:hypothetical protein
MLRLFDHSAARSRVSPMTRLGRGICRVWEPGCDQAEHTGNVDDGSAVLHPWGTRLSHPEDSVEVHVDRLAEPSGVSFKAPTAPPIPALSMSTSRRPWESYAVAATRVQSSGSLTLAVTASTTIPTARSSAASASRRSPRRAARTRFAPALASARAKPAPGDRPGRRPWLRQRPPWPGSAPAADSPIRSPRPSPESQCEPHALLGQ